MVAFMIASPFHDSTCQAFLKGVRVSKLVIGLLIDCVFWWHRKFCVVVRSFLSPVM